MRHHGRPFGDGRAVEKHVARWRQDQDRLERIERERRSERTPARPYRRERRDWSEDR